MDLLCVTEMFVEHTWKVSAAKVNLGYAPDASSLPLPLSDLTLLP